MSAPGTLGRRWLRGRRGDTRPEPGGRDLALRLLWGLLVLEFLLAFPILINPGGLGTWAWEGFAAAEGGAVVAIALLLCALRASERDGRVAYALAILGALIGAYALLLLAAAAYLP